MGSSRRLGRPPGTDPRYRAIAADISRRLKAGEWDDGDPIPSYQQFAKSYDVGVCTIRLAIRLLGRKGLVRIIPGRPTTALGRRPARSPLSDAIGIIVNWTGFNEEIRQLWMGIALQAGRSNHARVVMLQYLDKRDFLKPEGLGDLQLRGLLLACVTPPEQMNHLAALNIPVVLLDQAPMDCNVHSVTIDNFETAYDATVRLIELGHRRLAFFRSVVTNLKGIDPDSVERQQGFVMACMDAGLTEDNYKIFSAGFGESSAAATELVRARQPFSAVVTCNSVHAEQLESALRSVGLHIPRDLSIVAFQHAQKATGRWSGPAIDLREIGRRGAELIDRKPSNIERIYVDAPWYEGGSIARPRRNHV